MPVALADATGSFVDDCDYQTIYIGSRSNDSATSIRL